MNIDATEWWRRLCEVTPNLVLSGDLHWCEERAISQLAEWSEFGITHIIDCRGEHSDKGFVATHAPGIVYHDHGTHDAGGHQDGEWYEEGWFLFVQAVLDNPNAKVLVHCHMGINRAPSLGFFLLLRMGYGPWGALDMIRKARPIAACYYAESAWDTYCLHNTAHEAREVGQLQIDTFFIEHGIDLHDVIHQIREVEHA
jgi:hypothetical protein